jgi:hypothetical protein
MGVRLRHASVRGPARVTEPVPRLRAVGAGRHLQVLQVPDGADVVEAVVFAKHDPRRVVASVLEAFEALQQERLALARADVSDDSAHPEAPLSDFPGEAPPSAETRPLCCETLSKNATRARFSEPHSVAGISRALSERERR